MRQHDFDDETLVAFADGELDEATSEAVARAMETDPELAGRVEGFVATGHMLRDALGHVAREPVPAGLVRAVMAGEAMERKDAKGAAIGRAAPARGPRRAAPRWQPLAAAAACLVVGSAGYWAGLQGTPVGNAPLAPALASLESPLNTLADGARAGRSSGEIEIRSTLRTRRGLCRTFALSDAPRDAAFDGVACRAGETWRIEVLAARPAGGTIRPASAGGPVGAFLDSVEAEDPLPESETRRLRDGNWRE